MEYLFVGASGCFSARCWGQALSQQMLLLFPHCPNFKLKKYPAELSLQPHAHQEIISLSLGIALETARAVRPTDRHPSAAPDRTPATRQVDTSWAAHLSGKISNVILISKKTKQRVMPCRGRLLPLDGLSSAQPQQDAEAPQRERAEQNTLLRICASHPEASRLPRCGAGRSS